MPLIYSRYKNCKCPSGEEAPGVHQLSIQIQQWAAAVVQHLLPERILNLVNNRADLSSATMSWPTEPFLLTLRRRQEKVLHMGWTTRHRLAWSNGEAVTMPLTCPRAKGVARRKWRKCYSTSRHFH